LDEPFLKLLKAEIARKRRELNRYETALAMLEEQENQPVERPVKPKKQKQYPKRISEEKLTDLRKVILNIAQDKDEFRQIDVRSVTNISSSAAATGFEQLRQEGMIRLARKDGNNKYYRLTSEALRENGKQE
jgi:DNA-binding transcriptional ArsR family regulator